MQRLFIALLLTAMTTSLGGRLSPVPKTSMASTEWNIPYPGMGRLVVIMSQGRDRPDESRHLLVVEGAGTRRLEIERPTRVRWRSAQELIVEQFMRPIFNGSGIRILRVDRDGRILAVLSDRDGFSGTEVSRDGRWLLVDRYNEKGSQALEVCAIDQGLGVLHKDFAPGELGPASAAIWSPDGSMVAASMDQIDFSDPGRLVHPMVVASVKEGRFARSLETKPAPESMFPLVWLDAAIYAQSAGGLLRCKPSESACDLAYSPGEHRRIVKGRRFGSGKTLLLVRDLRVDPLDVRSKEIHEVDLATGEGRVFWRAPDGVFLNDLDWIEDGP